MSGWWDWVARRQAVPAPVPPFTNGLMCTQGDWHHLTAMHLSCIHPLPGILLFCLFIIIHALLSCVALLLSVPALRWLTFACVVQALHWVITSTKASRTLQTRPTSFPDSKGRAHHRLGLVWKNLHQLCMAAALCLQGQALSCICMSTFSAGASGASFGKQESSSTTGFSPCTVARRMHGS